jgi:putative transposase
MARSGTVPYKGFAGCAMDNRIRHRKQIHLKNFDYKTSSYVYFITICAANNQPYFLNKKVAKVVTDELEFRRINKEIKLFCYCVMPDHVHILLSLTDTYQKSLQNLISAFKRYTAKVTNELFSIKPLWQKNFYDYVVRKDESLLKIAEYILNNPVRKGVVSNWEEYPYSKMIDVLPL